LSLYIPKFALILTTVREDMAKAKIGIVGVGKLGNFHCNSVSQLPNAELVGVYDVDENQRKEIAEKYNCTSFATYSDLLDNIDILGVVVPTINHLEVAKQAIQAGKHVFVEKPIASTIAEAEDLVSLAKKAGVKMQVGHIEQFNPAIRALEPGYLNPMFIESHRLSPFDPRGTDVAVVLDLMIHDIDIILSLVKSTPTRIDANGVAVVSDQVDIANARIQFENGCVANVTASRISQKKMRKMRLFQKDSYVSIDFLQRLSEVFKIDNDKDSDKSTVILGQIEKGKHKKNIVYEKPEIPADDAMQAEWKSFLKAIKENSTPVVSGQDGLEALNVATKITETISQQTTEH
jgi:predicted dehydrogenase